MNGTDKSTITTQLFKTITASNFRANVNGDGTINSTDTSSGVSNFFKPMGNAATPVAVAAAVINSPTSTNVTASGARLGATVTDAGGDRVRERGVVFLLGSSGSPTVDDPGSIAVLADDDTGAFTVDVTGLLPSQDYVFRGFVRTSFGVVYTDVGTFTTSAS